VGSLRHLSESDDERVFLGCKPWLTKCKCKLVARGRGKGVEHAYDFQHHVDACKRVFTLQPCSSYNLIYKSKIKIHYHITLIATLLPRDIRPTLSDPDISTDSQ
jgi:hypothetical protein